MEDQNSNETMAGADSRRSSPATGSMIELTDRFRRRFRVRSDKIIGVVNHPTMASDYFGPDVATNSIIVLDNGSEYAVVERPEKIERMLSSNVEAWRGADGPRSKGE